MKMFKKKGIIPAIACLLIPALAAAAFAGCSAAGDNKTAEAASVKAEAERVVIYGEITETVGNMITLSLIERAEPRELTEEEQAAMRERMAQFGDGSGWADMTEEERAALQEQFAQNGGRIRSSDMTDEERAALQEQFAQNGGPIRNGDMTDEERAALQEQFAQNGGPIRSGDMTDEERAALQERLAQNGGSFPAGQDGAAGGAPFGIPGGGRTYTGETKDIIIPAGAPILESASSNGEESQTEISLDKLKAGDIIEVTYASDNETVAKVVKQPAAQGAGRFYTGGGADGGGFMGAPDGNQIFMIPDGGGGGQVFGEAPAPAR